MREDIVIGVQADLSGYESQMKRMADEAAAGMNEAASEVESLSGRMLDSHTALYAEIGDLASESFSERSGLLADWLTEQNRADAAVSHLESSAAGRHFQREREKLDASRLFLDGVSEGYARLQDELTEWSDAGRRTFQAFVSQSAGFFENSLFAVLKGKFDDIGDAWQDMVDSMLHAFLGALAEMAAQNLAESVMGALSGGSLSGSLLSWLGLSSGELPGGGWISGIVESGANLVTGALEGIGEFFGGLFDREAEGGSGSDIRFIPDSGSAASSRPGPARMEASRIEVHIHGDTLADADTLNRVAVKIGDALTRHRRRLYYGV